MDPFKVKTIDATNIAINPHKIPSFLLGYKKNTGIK